MVTTKAPMLRQTRLAEVAGRNYMRTAPLWVPYGKCLGFRYNVSGTHSAPSPRPPCCETDRRASMVMC